MKTLTVLEPEKLTAEEVAALRRVGFDVQPLGTFADAPYYASELEGKALQAAQEWQALPSPHLRAGGPIRMPQKFTVRNGEA